MEIGVNSLSGVKLTTTMSVAKRRYDIGGSSNGGFLTQYENNKVKKSLFSEYEKIMEKHVETYQKVFPNTSDDKIEPTLKISKKL